MATKIFPSANDINGGLSGDGKTLKEASFAQLISLLTSRTNKILSGFALPGTDPDLTISIPAGSAIVAGRFVIKDAAENLTLAASATNHIYLQVVLDGSNNATAANFVANTTGTAPSNSIKIGQAITNANEVTSTSTEPVISAVGNNPDTNHDAVFFDVGQEIGKWGTIYSRADSGVSILRNAKRVAGAWVYRNTGEEANLLEFNSSGALGTWYAASGTAGAAITFTLKTMVPNGGDGFVAYGQGTSTGIKGYGGPSSGNGIYGESGAPSGIGVLGKGFWGVYGLSEYGSGNGVRSGATGANSIGVAGIATGTASTGVYGDGIGYDFYAGGPGTNYGPFTGGHDGLVALDFSAEPGDIVCDDELISRKNVSNTIFESKLSSHPMDKRAIGVFVGISDISESNAPSALIKCRNYEINESIEFLIPIEEVKKKWKRISFNALGEGQINVCPENGDIDAGDFICTSSIPGKGMKQPDDLLRSYTVAKARESVRWDKDDTSPKTIACIYLCG